MLALEKRYMLDLNPADDQTVYERYMVGTAEGKIDMLTELIESIIEQKG
jgi:cell filamentation protein